MIRFLGTILVLLAGAWLALSSGFVDSDSPHLEHAWSVLMNDSDSEHSQHQSLTYTCPMHPDILSDRPGECPICGMDLVPLETEKTETKPREGEEMTESRPSEVLIEPQMIHNLGVQTERVELRELSRELRFTGEVAVDDSTMELLQSWVEGRVEKIYLEAVGDKIAKGDPLIQIYSPQLLTTSEELISALQYAEELRERGALRQSILDAEAMADAAEKRLRLWGLSAEQLDLLKETRQVTATVTVYATASGTVHKKMVHEGQYVKEGSPLYELIDLEELWVYLNVFENELGQVYQGMPVSFTTPAFEAQSFRGTVSRVEPMMDSKSRTAKVRVAVANPSGRLIPGMYVESKIQIPISPGVPSVSNLAVIRTGKKDLVLVASGGGRFYPQEVRIGRAADGYYPVLEGLDVGQEVVSQASFLLDSESQLKAALQKLSGGGHQH